MGLTPAVFVEVWARETWTRTIDAARQIAAVRNRWGLGINVVSISLREGP